MEKNKMTLKSLNKKFSVLSTAVLVAASLSGLANLKVNAADSGTGTLVINAQQAAPNTSTTQNNTNPGNQDANGNDAGSGNTTGTQAGNQGSTSNDGSVQTVTGGTMANVTFSYTPITPTNTASGMKAPIWGTNGQTTAGTGYTAGTATNVTTNASGVATVNNLADGYYLVQQVTKVGGVYEIQPFIVHVNNNTTNVYPKLDLTTANAIYDTNTNNGKDTVTGTTNNTAGTPNNKDDDTAGANQLTDTNIKDNDNTNTAQAGNKVNWNLNATFDGSQVTNSDGKNSNGTTAPGSDTTGTTTLSDGNVTGSYQITETLPKGVTYDSTTGVTIPSVQKTNSDGTTTDVPLSLTSGTDYTVSTSGQTVTITLTPAGQEKVATALGAGQTGVLNVQVPTTVDDTAQGALKDSYTTTVTNAYGVDLSNGTAATSTLNVGGIGLTKEDTSGNQLTGAQFVLVKAANLADAQKLVKDNASSFNGSVPPKGITDGTAALVLNTAGTPVTATVGAANSAFTGIDLSGSGNSNSDATTGTSNGKSFAGTLASTGNYYVVEVKAPTGYDLPDPSTGANVFGDVLASTTTVADDNVVTNSKPFALPFTGGQGLAGIIIIAIAAGGAAIGIKRHKKSDEEAVEAK